ncbi:hypothetical protein CAPTEDRAFT_228203 [Capitella teleta]|uniref:Uncharacterized protein n=1 Tax=Capitella teleta TaxID=283909 RepID=R7V200_CAPTE|nr:hypothetical protein CAPTEDRAFT_228203 [Capitella teleta]|eukprot:ELU12517.1 hypothetical protein CAPTEDRAFT_228203 [Capitella teleta]
MNAFRFNFRGITVPIWRLGSRYEILPHSGAKKKNRQGAEIDVGTHACALSPRYKGSPKYRGIAALISPILQGTKHQFNRDGYLQKSIFVLVEQCSLGIRFNFFQLFISRINLELVFAAGFQVAFVWNYFVSSTVFYLSLWFMLCGDSEAELSATATCNDEQVHNCRKSANNGQLDKLSGGGSCQPKQYVQFTHICTVSHYLPSVDYCCCEHEQRVLCCRYHQDWDTFRCSQGEDTVDTISSSSLPLKILLPIIIGPIVILLCCVFCCVKCCCYRYDDDADMLCCTTCEDKREKLSKEKQPPSSSRPPPQGPDDASTPLTYGLAPTSSNAIQQSCPNCRHSLTAPDIKAYTCHHSVVEPSAPPVEDGPGPYSSPYATVCLREKERPAVCYGRSQSEVAAEIESVHCACVNRNSVYRSLSAGTEVVRPCPTCQGSGHGVGGGGQCAPPSYDESLSHQVLPLTTATNVHTTDAEIIEKC